jgi:hypothetical protein
MASDILHSISHLFYKWQTLTAGLLALAAAWMTVRATIKAADREVDAAREQTSAAQKQTETILRLERQRLAREARGFFEAFYAAMGIVLEDVAAARKLSEGNIDSSTACKIRQRITKELFANIRNSLLRFGEELTAPFLRLERSIDLFARDYQRFPVDGWSSREKSTIFEELKKNRR